MAHNADRISWHLIASDLRYLPFSHEHDGVTNLFSRHMKTSGLDSLRLVAREFQQRMGAATLEESSKHWGNIQPFAAGDEVIAPAIAKRTKHTRNYYRENLTLSQAQVSPNDANVLNFWTRNLKGDACSGQRIESGELLNTLLIHGELETLLRLAATADMSTQIRTHYTLLFPENTWKKVLRSTLKIYVCLNILYCKPELRDSPDRLGFFSSAASSLPLPFTNDPRQWDYRRTKAYQTVIVDVATHRMADVHMFPHREFFGISSNEARFYSSAVWCNMAPGKTDFDRLQSRLNQAFAPFYLPHAKEIAVVREILRTQGLPLELALDVLEFADYRPQRRLFVEHDPFDHRNHDELQAYMEYCWRLLVQCSVLASWCHINIEWKFELNQCVRDLFDLEKCITGCTPRSSSDMKSKLSVSLG